MKVLSQGITAPQGFSAAGIFCGIKRKRKDLSMILSDVPCTYAGVFTRNIVKAAPVIWNQQILKQGTKVRGLIVNSGNANACTGIKGMEDAETMARVFAEQVGANTQEILVASTGVIGQNLPMEKIKKGILDIVTVADKGRAAAINAAEGIMTTDTFMKEMAIEFDCDGENVRIAGIAKGSGMIHPNMGTMLSFITTDAKIDQEVLIEIMRSTTDDTYNMISVDGDTSTNDMCLVMANGLAMKETLKKGSKGYDDFVEAFFTLNRELSKLIIKDGEGATKFIEVTVKNMHDKEEARKMVRAVITSNLVKTAFFGEDANWGRILCALGYSGAMFDTSKVEVKYINEVGEILLLDQGQPIAFSEEFALEVLKQKEIQILVDCHQGDQEATGWGCDLSYDYVKINGEYRT